MRVTLVCGLLGAGKTSFIMNLLKDSTERSVVLVNDFGSAGIDGRVVSSGGIETIELPSGCVCCSLKTGLLESIQKIAAEFSPEHLVIEPSGVASPSGVLEALSSVDPDVKFHMITVIGIIDASEYLELYDNDVYGRFFVEQISLSDIVIVNKTDLADRPTTDSTIALIRKVNPLAKIHEAVGGKAEADLSGIKGSGMRATIRAEHHFGFGTFSFRPRGELPYVFVESLFADMSAGIYGKLVRAKALINTDRGPFRFDLAWSTTNAAPFEPGVSENLMVVIGNDIQHDNLSRLFGGGLALRHDT